jgi:uncharacterized membrane protein
MWTSTDAVTLETRMTSYPDYDSAMFLAYLTIVPSLAAFVMSLETDFFEHYVRFYRDIQKHATLAQIEADHQRILVSVRNGARNFVILQASICLTTILLAPQIFTFFNVNFAQLGMFRIGVLGAFFHVLFLATTIIVSYFDLRSVVLKLQIVFLISNGVLTYLSMNAGFTLYGYGYFLASVIAFVCSFVVLARFIGQLPYQAFVANNPSVK